MPRYELNTCKPCTAVAYGRLILSKRNLLALAATLLLNAGCLRFPRRSSCTQLDLRPRLATSLRNLRRPKTSNMATSTPALLKVASTAGLYLMEQNASSRFVPTCGFTKLVTPRCLFRSWQVDLLRDNAASRGHAYLCQPHRLRFFTPCGRYHAVV